MSENIILKMVTGYKKTSAFLAAIDLGIFDLLHKKNLMINSLSEDLMLDKNMLECLLNYLEAEGLVRKNKEYWELTTEFQHFEKDMNNYINIINHEKNLYNNWITPQSVASSIKNGSGRRAFDIRGFDTSEMESYCKVMYGRNLEIIAFWIRRELGGLEKADILELGRSYGAISKILKKQIPNMTSTLAINNRFWEMFNKSDFNNNESFHIKAYKLDEFEYCGCYNLICIYNTVHYYEQEELRNIFNNIKKLMNKGSLICIADIFFKNEDSFNSTLLLDWITHGGIYNTQLNDVTKLLSDTGFSRIKHKYIQQISTDLVFASL